MKTVGVIGLGNMGRGMALSLRRGGYRRARFRRGARRCREACRGRRRGARVDCGHRARRRRADTVAADIGDRRGGRAGRRTASRRTRKPGLIVVDTTTADPNSTRKVAAALAECRIGFVDGPVSGGPKGAATATMTMVLGGSEAGCRGGRADSRGDQREARACRPGRRGARDEDHQQPADRRASARRERGGARGASRRASIPRSSSRRSTAARAATARRSRTTRRGFSTTSSTPASR